MEREALWGKVLVASYGVDDLGQWKLGVRLLGRFTHSQDDVYMEMERVEWEQHLRTKLGFWWVEAISYLSGKIIW